MKPGMHFRLSALVLLLACPFARCGLLAQEVHVYLTTPDLKNPLAAQKDGSFTPAAPTAGPTITVDEREHYQTMDGFGASLTDGAAWLLEERLTVEARQRVMEQLFDPVHGIGLSFLRQPIAATDLSRNEYSFDEVPDGGQDPEMRLFTAGHDDSYVFPAIREALRLNPGITVMATPWSPPAWMKTSLRLDGGSLREEAMPAYAAYLVRSLQAFKAAGVPVKYLTLQNEPLHDTTDFPGALLPAAQEKRLIGQYVGPALRHAGLQTEVLAYDHNWDHPEYPLELLADPAAAPYLAGSALHCYGGRPLAQTAIHEQFPDKGIWMTECSGGTWQRESPLAATTHLLMDSTRNWAKAVVLWGTALDTDRGPHSGGCDTCRGLVTIDLKQSPATVTYEGDFYALGHASRFVHLGATRIGSTSPGRESLETVAFENRDGSIALLALNNRALESQFSIRWHGLVFPTSLPAGSLATYVWHADDNHRRGGNRRGDSSGLP